MELLPPFLIGILGSFHCLGMCGPLVLAVPHKNTGVIGKAFDSLIYNIGRIITYTIMGAFIGFVGFSTSLSRYQADVSLVMGIILVLSLFIFPKKINTYFTKFKFVAIISEKFKKIFGATLSMKSHFSLIILGALNGLLPCGLVYAALAASVASSAKNPDSMVFMAVFGLGTLPMMFAAFLFKNVITLNIRKRITKLIPLGIAVIAVLLILRGLSLGIPYISPVLPEVVGENVPPCCR